VDDLWVDQLMPVVYLASLEVLMCEPRSLLSWIVVLLIACVLAGCGTGQSPNVRLQSVTINPATASSQAQFTATGTYTDGSKVTPLPALWFTIRPWYNAANPVQFFNLDKAGKASCNGNAGTFSVAATAPADPHFPLSQMNSTTPQVSGMAQLICQ
jgi:hypothetical protein